MLWNRNVVILIGAALTSMGILGTPLRRPRFPNSADAEILLAMNVVTWWFILQPNLYAIDMNLMMATATALYAMSAGCKHILFPTNPRAQ